MVQRHPNQSHAFYSARGFDSKSVNQYVSNCIFHSSLNNLSGTNSLAIDLSDWNVRVKSPEQKIIKLIPTKEWMHYWENNNVSRQAQIAFKFSQLPTIQNSGPGDWFQGMISIPVESSESFDLELVWKLDNEKQHAILENINCDISNMEP